jgi:hypothetical protein
MIVKEFGFILTSTEFVFIELYMSTVVSSLLVTNGWLLLGGFGLTFMKGE